MCESGKLSFGHTLLTSVKSIHVHHLPFFFFTTELASHSGYCTSRIYQAPSNRSTSSLIAFDRSGPSFLLFCLISLKVGSTFSSCIVIARSIPFMSVVVQAKVETLSLRKEMIFSLRSSTWYTNRLNEPNFLFYGPCGKIQSIS